MWPEDLGFVSSHAITYDLAMGLVAARDSAWGWLFT